MADISLVSRLRQAYGAYCIRETLISKPVHFIIYGGTHFFPVRVKGGMSLRNGMWHGLRNDIIMRNLIHGQWCKEINLTGTHACVIASPFLAPI